MVCLKCGNVNNFILFQGEMIYIKNGNKERVEKCQTRIMCNECFSCDVLEDVSKNVREAAA